MSLLSRRARATAKRYRTAAGFPRIRGIRLLSNRYIRYPYLLASFSSLVYGEPMTNSDRFTVAVQTEPEASRLAFLKGAKGLHPKIEIVGEHFLISYDADHSADAHIARVTKRSGRS